MRALLPGPVDDIDVHAYYAAGWVDRGGLRVNFVTSVDGAAASGGVSKALQTPGDNRVFAALRDLADVVLVGSGTARAEKYGPVSFSASRKAIRRRHGLRDTMPVAVLSSSLNLDPDSRLFTEAVPGARSIVITCEQADAEQRRLLKHVADVIDCGDESVEPALARRALEDRGLTRILCEGGPSIFGDVAADGVADELCLSISPVLAGAGAGRIINGADWPSTLPLTLVGLLEDDGALFCRYRLG